MNLSGYQLFICSLITPAPLYSSLIPSIFAYSSREMREADERKTAPAIKRNRNKSSNRGPWHRKATNLIDRHRVWWKLKIIEDCRKCTQRLEKGHVMVNCRLVDNEWMNEWTTNWTTWGKIQWECIKEWRKTSESSVLRGFNVWVTDRLTDRPTDGRTDMTSNRCARMH